MDDSNKIEKIKMFIIIDKKKYRFILPRTCIYMCPLSMSVNIIQHDKYHFYTKRYFEEKYKLSYERLEELPKDLLIKIIDESYFSTN